MHIVAIETVYGDRLHVARESLDDPRKVLLTLYTRKGVQWSDTQAYQRERRRLGGAPASHVHRENIARVLD